MDEVILDVLNTINIQCKNISDINNRMIERDFFLKTELYFLVKPKINNLKNYVSSSYLTSLQCDAEKTQKWPLLNLVRQLLKLYKYNMKPIRKSNGYDKSGKKLYKRFFLISNT
tara:strand:+ start:260 stop:601 length:342 start_codon:yes stop_codon:yes gene_type:complete